MHNQNYSYEAPQVSGDLFNTIPLTYASFWKRFAATIIDGVILTMVFGVAAFLLPLAVYYVIAIVGGWLYFALQESGSAQATLGKKALGIKVVDENGGQLSFGAASGRHFAKFLSGLILYIGYLMVLWDSRKQGLHDKIAGTLVIENKPQYF